MAVEVLDALERVFEGILMALATVGTFVFTVMIINRFYGGTLGAKEYTAIASVATMVVFYLRNGLRKVQYNKLEIMTDEYEAEIKKHNELRGK